jgi:1,4-alpha-glucan branching enzyme
LFDLFALDANSILAPRSIGQQQIFTLCDLHSVSKPLSFPSASGTNNPAIERTPMARKKATKSAQTFSIHAPAASTVLLAGSFTHWQQDALPMTKTENGNWSITLPLAPGTYYYRFIVDGEWLDDPACTLHVDNPYGSRDNVRSVI